MGEGEEEGPEEARMSRLRIAMWQLLYRVLPRDASRRLALSRIDREYRAKTKTAKESEREALAYWRGIDRDIVDERYALEDSHRLLRRARRYHVAPPPRPTATVAGVGEGNEHWTFSPLIDDWYLTTAGLALVHRQIEEAELRRRARADTWIKVAGVIFTGLAVAVSLYLGLRK